MIYHTRFHVFRAGTPVLFGLFLLLFGLCSGGLRAQKPIGDLGLCLSGGGAKGFAHIGVLRIIDSLGIQVDHLSGTSMGSIVGGLYASGYSAAEIEAVALTVDWSQVFKSKSELSDIPIRQRFEAGKRLLDLPFERGQLILSTGAIEGQRLWMLLERLFFHVREVEDFSQFPINYACVATDLERGEAVVMNSGDIVSALRASMAIPAVFSSVDRNQLRLVDGGVVNNFPVDVVQKMGADFVLGVNVSQGLRSAAELRTPLDIIYQMGFFKDAERFALNRAQTDIYLEPDLQRYDAADFGSVAAIIAEGKKAARRALPQLQALAAAQKSRAPKPDLAPRARRFRLGSLSFRGLENIQDPYLRALAAVQPGDSLGAEDISRILEHLYATGYFVRINYHFHEDSQQAGAKQLVFSFQEKPLQHLQLGLHYNTFMGVGLIGGLSSDKLGIYPLNGSLSFRLGEQSNYRLRLDLFTRSDQKHWLRLEAEGFSLDFPFKERFQTVGAYEQNYHRAQLSQQFRSGPNAYSFLGIGAYRQNLKPTVLTDFSVQGHNQGYELFAGYHLYQVDRHAFPRQGQRLDLRGIYFFGQNPEAIVVSGDSSFSDLSQIGIVIQSFWQLQFRYEWYRPWGAQWAYHFNIQGGYNFNYRQGFLNMFNLGGTALNLRDQFYFAGFNEYELLSPALLSSRVGGQYQLGSSDFFLSPELNAAVVDYQLENLAGLTRDNFVLGAALSAGYRAPMGPLQASLAYSPQTNRLLAYLNLGWSF